MANKDWQNDESLIYNRIKYMQNNSAAQATYGFMLNRESEQMPEGEERRNKEAQAMNAFMQSIKIYPDFYWSWISIGKLFARQHVNDKSELCFIKAQQIEPFSADSYFCLGSLYFSTGDTAMAINYLEKCVLIEPSMEVAYVMLGKSYLGSNNIVNLGALTESALKWFPSNAELIALRAVYFYRLGKYKEAIPYVMRALQIDSKNFTANSIYGQPLIQRMIHYGDSTKTFLTPAP